MTDPPQLAGKDYFTQAEAAAYACVSLSQFRARADEYGIRPVQWMGKLVYRRGDIARAIEQEYARQWQRSTPAARPTTSSGRRMAGNTGAA